METTTRAENQGAKLRKLEYGCKHYRRRCKIRAPCCNQIFTCRFCHNEAMELSNPIDHHELIREEIRSVICAICDVEQPVARVCCNCGVTMGEYFCEVCKLYDDETFKMQYHCSGFGICRVGGQKNTFHCSKCGCCYPRYFKERHTCKENYVMQNCSICFENVFHTRLEIRELVCGHIIHTDCSQALYGKSLVPEQFSLESLIRLRCPICFKTIGNMAGWWHMLDVTIAANPTPEDHKYEVSILCNDCRRTSKVPFHKIGLKCDHCRSYNTCRL